MCSVSCPQNSTGWAPPGPSDSPRTQQPAGVRRDSPISDPGVRAALSLGSEHRYRQERRAAIRDFVDEQIDDLAITGRNSARWKGRDVISPQDLPITKGVQERMREFDKLEEAERIRELLRQQVRRPPAEVTFAEDTEQMLPEVFGGLNVALARTLRVIDPKLTNPTTSDWERSFALFRRPCHPG
jgi:hypothetical protein